MKPLKSVCPPKSSIPFHFLMFLKDGQFWVTKLVSPYVLLVCTCGFESIMPSYCISWFFFFVFVFFLNIYTTITLWILIGQKLPWKRVIIVMELALHFIYPFLGGFSFHHLVQTTTSLLSLKDITLLRFITVFCGLIIFHDIPHIQTEECYGFE